MILSFHPCFKADRNITCAGRLPNKADLSSIRKADAVVLSQGCSEELYRMARDNCTNVFPNFDAKFSYPGKTGQIELFKLKEAPHPESWIYSSVNAFIRANISLNTPIKHQFPFVFKFDWGGEGQTVFLVQTKKMLAKLLEKATAFEKSGHSGFLIQQYIKSSSKTLRIVIIGEMLISYWKVQSKPSSFGEYLNNGAYIDKNVNSVTLTNSVDYVKKFCSRTGINLAGFDLIFSKNKTLPFLLEINYFFGRRGLGGSIKYYELLRLEINKWIASIGLPIPSN